MDSEKRHLPDHIIQTINTLIGPYGYELKALIQAYETENSLDGDRWLSMDAACEFCSLTRYTMYRLACDPDTNIVMTKTYPGSRSSRVLFLRSALHNFLLRNSNIK